MITASGEVLIALTSGGSLRITGELRRFGRDDRPGPGYSPNLLRALAELAQPDWVSVDVEADIGVLALALGRACPQGKVHALEPSTERFRFLERNLALNSAHNVFIHPADAAGNATIDEFALSEGIERLDLVHIDAGGAEPAVVAGALTALRAHHPMLVVHYDPVAIRRAGRGDPETMLGALRSLYRFTARVPESGPLQPVVSRRHLHRLLAAQGSLDLVFTRRPLLPGRDPYVASPQQAAREFLLGLAEWHRPPHPTYAIVTSPCVRLVPEPPSPGVEVHLSGHPGQRVELSLFVLNDGREPIIGGLGPHGVQIRWAISTSDDAELGDDAPSRPAPVVRPHSGRQVSIPLVLPNEPGTYGVAVGLWQDPVGWLHELGPGSICRLEVSVVA